MTNRYEVRAEVEGESTNEVASKIMVAAYAQDFEITSLEVSLLDSQPDTARWLAEHIDPELEDPNRPFEFPHVKTLIEGLQKKRGRDADPAT